MRSPLQSLRTQAPTSARHVAFVLLQRCVACALEFDLRVCAPTQIATSTSILCPALQKAVTMATATPSRQTTCGMRAGRPNLEVFPSAFPKIRCPSSRTLGGPRSSSQAVARRGPVFQHRYQPRQPRRSPQQLGLPTPVQRTDHPKGSKQSTLAPSHAQGLHQRQPRVQAQVGNAKARPPVPNHATLRAHGSGQKLVLNYGQRRYQERAGPLCDTVWSDTPTTDDPHNAWLHDEPLLHPLSTHAGLWQVSVHIANVKPATAPMPDSLVADSSMSLASTSPLAELVRAENRSKMLAALPYWVPTLARDVNSTPTNTARTELHSMITFHHANTRGSS